jgi:hypothetical protein
MQKFKNQAWFLIVFLLGIVLAFAAPAKDPGNKPDFNGVWLAFASSPPFVRGAPSPLSENGEKTVNAFYEKYGDKYVEPGAYCVPPGMPSTMTAIVGYPIEIIQTEDRLTMLAELEMQVRRIYIDGRKIPENYPATRMGYSVGSWDRDTLVIDTALLKPSPLRGWPRSEHTRIQERIHMLNRAEVKARPSSFIITEPINDKVLAVEMTVTDPTLYKEPRKVTIYYMQMMRPWNTIVPPTCGKGPWMRHCPGGSPCSAMNKSCQR